MSELRVSDHILGSDLFVVVLNPNCCDKGSRNNFSNVLVQCQLVTYI